MVVVLIVRITAKIRAAIFADKNEEKNEKIKQIKKMERNKIK